MSNKAPKTEGLDWLLLSLASFNGSGYADMSSSQSFLDSYVAYKSLRQKKQNRQAVILAKVYRVEALEMLDTMLAHTKGAGRKPQEKYVKRVRAVQQQQADQLGLL